MNVLRQSVSTDDTLTWTAHTASRTAAAHFDFAAVDHCPIDHSRIDHRSEAPLKAESHKTARKEQSAAAGKVLR
jgi:hypothetical protein